MSPPDHAATPLPWPLPDQEALRNALVAAYDDPGRGYHDLLHLTEVLERIEELAPTVRPELDRDVVVLAAWFHDAVYDGEPGAEERSARWAERALPSTGLVDDRVAEVARLVRLTEQHRPDDADLAGCVLSDADLAILASGDERYAEYVATVRREYAHVSDADFAAGRAAVLADLLAKPTLFHTSHAQRHWEPRARRNVSAELDHLQAQ